MICFICSIEVTCGLEKSPHGNIVACPSGVTAADGHALFWGVTSPVKPPACSHHTAPNRYERLASKPHQASTKAQAVWAAIYTSRLSHCDRQQNDGR